VQIDYPCSRQISHSSIWGQVSQNPSNLKRCPQIYLKGKLVNGNLFIVCITRTTERQRERARGHGIYIIVNATQFSIHRFELGHSILTSHCGNNKDPNPTILQKRKNNKARSKCTENKSGVIYNYIAPATERMNRRTTGQLNIHHPFDRALDAPPIAVTISQKDASCPCRASCATWRIRRPLPRTHSWRIHY